MKMAPLAEVKAKFSAYVKQCEHEPIVVTRNGRPVAMLVPFDDDPWKSPQGEDDIERALLAHNREFIKILREARARIRAGKGIPADEFWRELENGMSQEASDDGLD